MWRSAWPQNVPPASMSCTDHLAGAVPGRADGLGSTDVALPLGPDPALLQHSAADHRARPSSDLQVRPAEVQFRRRSGHNSESDRMGSLAPISAVKLGYCSPKRMLRWETGSAVVGG